MDLNYPRWKGALYPDAKGKLIETPQRDANGQPLVTPLRKVLGDPIQIIQPLCPMN